MSIFKKTNDKIEILDLTTSTKQESTIEKKKDIKIIIISIVFIILFVFVLPYITSLLKKESPINYTNEVNNSKNTTNGMLLIGDETGYIKEEGVQFYMFAKRNNNNISYTYKTNSRINDVSNLNLYIELYNQNFNLIYRTLFIPSKTLSKGVFIGNININETFYGEAYYAKVVAINSDKLSVDDSMVCNKSIVDGVYSLNYKIQYNFGSTSLLNYEVTKSVKAEIINGSKYIKEFEEEQSKIIMLGEAANIIEGTLSYKVNLKRINVNEANDVLLYKRNDSKRLIKYNEEHDGWSCK